MVAGVTHSGSTFSALSLEETKDMLSINQGGCTMYDRARQRFLGLLLNIVSNKLEQYMQASDDGATVSQAIACIESLLGFDDESAKDIATTLNSGQIVETGIIPLSTPNVIFGDEISEISQPLTFEFKNPFPNPFNPKAAFSIQLSVFSFVDLAVYDMAGRKVAELVNGWRDAGVHEVTFDATGFASGIYIYQIEAGEFNATGKLVLLK
jgi:hypothetical protein